MQEEDYAALSSKQIGDTLDHLLKIAVEPLFNYSDLGQCLALQAMTASIDNRRKISSLDRKELACIIMKSLAVDGPKRLETLYPARLERNIYTDLIQDAIVVGYIPGPRCEKEPMLRHIKVLFEHYNEFKEGVAMKYYYHARKVAAKNHQGKEGVGLKASLGDHENSLQLALLRAIDKFDSNQGTLTSYINTWFRNVENSQFLIYPNEGFSITRSGRKKLAEGEMVGRTLTEPLENHFEMEDGADSPEDTSVYSSHTKDLTNFIHNIEYCKLIALLMEIPFFPTEEELETQQAP